jgi:hypothetical protein
MVWFIVSIKSDIHRTSILFQPKSEVVNPTGPLGGNYVLAFPSLGYVTLTDNGNKGALKIALYFYWLNLSHLVPGGDWSVKFSGATNGAGNWFYSGEGKAQIDLEKGGEYTVSGGTGPKVHGKL